MRDMLVAGGANRGRYGEAMSIYAQLLEAAPYLGEAMRLGDEEERDAATASRRMSQSATASAWDDRSQETILARLAVATAVELAVPVIGRFTHGGAIDPVRRYLHFERAYKVSCTIHYRHALYTH
jgi:hypothetical protein